VITFLNPLVLRVAISSEKERKKYLFITENPEPSDIINSTNKICLFGSTNKITIHAFEKPII